MVSVRPVLARFGGNPVLSPIESHWWESKAVFNPAALLDSGRVHLLYRAIGDAEVSVLGYASSADGFHFDERLAEPVYVPREPWEGAGQQAAPAPRNNQYASGGGFAGGCEDPRMTRIGERVYLTYVAYSGFSHPRSALSSIALDDFRSKRWRWQRSALISPPDIIDKNACLLPERVGGKYVMLHRVFPDILIDYLDSLDFDGVHFLTGPQHISPRPAYWDSRKVGAGPPPLLTERGWLLIYHAVGNKDPGRYKIGAMLLDREQPSKVLARTAAPLLAPDASYENEGWKAGVAYPCGAVIIGGTVFVYYGGADRTVCVATVPLPALLEELALPRNAVHETPVPPVRPKVPETDGWCFRCRARRTITNGKMVLLKNGRLAVRGTCRACGGNIVRLVRSSPHSQQERR